MGEYIDMSFYYSKLRRIIYIYIYVCVSVSVVSGGLVGVLLTFYPNVFRNSNQI